MAATKSVLQHYDKSLYSLSEHNQCVTKIAKSRGTAYGSNITPHHFVHHWQLKILQFHNPQSQMFIGIHHSNKKPLKHEGEGQLSMSQCISYGYGSVGRRFGNNGKTKKFGSKYHVGDIVHIVLHLSRGTIGFGVNDSPIQEAYKIKDAPNCNYCLAIFLPSVDDTVSLLSYQVSESPMSREKPSTNEHKQNDSMQSHDDAEANRVSPTQSFTLKWKPNRHKQNDDTIAPSLHVHTQAKSQDDGKANRVSIMLQKRDATQSFRLKWKTNTHVHKIRQQVYAKDIHAQVPKHSIVLTYNDIELLDYKRLVILVLKYIVFIV
eukprot:137279_1